MNQYTRFAMIGLLSVAVLLTGTGCAGDFYPGGGVAVRSYSSPYYGGYGPYYGETIAYGGGYGYHRGYYGDHHFYGRGYRTARIGNRGGYGGRGYGGRGYGNRGYGNRTYGNRSYGGSRGFNRGGARNGGVRSGRRNAVMSGRDAR